MKTVVHSCLLALILAFTSPLAVVQPVWAEEGETESSEFTLLVGEQKAIDVSNISSVSIGEKKIATATLAGNQLLLTGKAAGVTTLTLIDRAGGSLSYSVKIIARDPRKVAEEITTLLTDVEGVEVKVIGDRVFIDGFVYRDVDQERVQRVAEIYEEAVNLTTFSKAYLTMRRLINVDYYRYEVQKVDAFAIGVNWTDFFGNAQARPEYTYLVNGGNPLTNVSTLNGTRDQGGQVALTSSFNPVSMNQDDTNFRLLDQHQVTVKEGSTAEYHVGGEFPIVYVTQFASTVEFKSYGAIFKVTPEIDKQDNINIVLDVSMSSLDFSLDALGYPGFDVVKQSTELNLKSGQSIAVGGYVSERKSKNETGLPGMSQIPVLGYFFGKKDFRKDRTDGVVFITPSVVAPVDSIDNDPRVRAVQEAYEQDDFKL